MASDNPNATVRLFVAIPVPKPVRDELIRATQELRRLDERNRVRWTPPKQFHLTLKFLGEVAVARVEALKAGLSEVVTVNPGLNLRVCGLGVFPNASQPRVLWAAVHESTGGLVELQRRIEDALLSLTPEIRAEPFVGHVTLGRIKIFRAAEMKNLQTATAEMPERDFGTWRADAVELIRSELAAEGARHTPMAAFRLPGPPLNDSACGGP